MHFRPPLFFDRTDPWRGGDRAGAQKDGVAGGYTCAPGKNCGAKCGGGACVCGPRCLAEKGTRVKI